MAIYFGIDSNYAGTLFSSLNHNQSSTTGFSGLTSLLSEYSSIKSGAYAKLAKKYYSEESGRTDTKSDTKTDTNWKDTSISKDSTKTLGAVEDATDKLKDAADALLATGKSSVFQKIEKKGDDGVVRQSYDSKKIYEAVKSFADQYNAVLDQAKDAKSSSIQSDYKSMQMATQGNQKLLASLGLTVDTDGKLAIDKEKFESADMGNAKSLFQGAGSYGYQISAKASMMNFHAQNESTKANTYTGNGTYSYNYSSGSLYDSLF